MKRFQLPALNCFQPTSCQVLPTDPFDLLPTPQDAVNKGATDYPIECEPDCMLSFYSVSSLCLSVQPPY